MQGIRKVVRNPLLCFVLVMVLVVGVLAGCTSDRAPADMAESPMAVLSLSRAGPRSL